MTELIQKELCKTIDGGGHANKVATDNKDYDQNNPIQETNSEFTNNVSTIVLILLKFKFKLI